MIETNIFLIEHGEDLHLHTRFAFVIGQNISADLLQRACGVLRQRYRIAAIPHYLSDKPALLAVSTKPIHPIIIEDEDWRLEIEDANQDYKLGCSNSEDIALLTDLLERYILIEAGRRTDLWSMARVPRILYQPVPILKRDDISAYRRFHISVVPLESIGLGTVVHVSTAFFTNKTVADYHCGNLPNDEQERLRQRFEILRQRQRGQKGTLLYDTEDGKSTCYFEEFLPGVTCSSTGPIRVREVTYPSLYHYYCDKHPRANIKEDNPVAKVSFRGIKQPQPVAANRLYLRVMNEMLPESLKNVDKIAPSERSRLAREFWDRVGSNSFGSERLNLQHSCWSPDQLTALIPLPVLEFAGNQRLMPPRNATVEEYKRNYGARLRLLRDLGCWHIPSYLDRNIYFALPGKASQEMANRLCQDLTDLLAKWTQKNITYLQTPRYSAIDDAVNSLNSETHSGTVVFVFEDEDPATYFKLSYYLKQWRIKRITYRELESHFNNLVKAEEKSQKEGDRLPEGVRHWRSFVEMNALDVLQQLDCIPWVIASPLTYEAQLAIDVGVDRRYFALSLLICRDRSLTPAFCLYTLAEPKADTNHETINEEILEDKIIEIFQRAQRRQFSPLQSILVLRDGRECGREIEGIASAQKQLTSLGLLAEHARVDVVDYHKQSVEGIRLWNRTELGETNVLEGTALFLDDRRVVIATTGEATVTQGTAEPAVLVANGDGIDMRAVTTSVVASAQLNWSSPRVAQRLPMPLKQTDDELRRRTFQEIRGIR
jgi:hypothetical protein